MTVPSGNVLPGVRSKVSSIDLPFCGVELSYQIAAADEQLSTSVVGMG